MIASMIARVSASSTPSPLSPQSPAISPIPNPFRWRKAATRGTRMPLTSASAATTGQERTSPCPACVRQSFWSSSVCAAKQTQTPYQPWSPPARWGRPGVAPPSSRFGAEVFQVLWEDGDRVLCRTWHRGADGERDVVLAVLLAAEQPAPAALDRLAHEYGLKDELDGVWAVRPLALGHERGRTMLVLEDSGGEPLERMLDAPLKLGR